MGNVEREVFNRLQIVNKLAAKQGLKLKYKNVEASSTPKMNVWMQTYEEDVYKFVCFDKYPTIKQFKQRINTAIKELLSELAEQQSQ